MVGRGFVPLEDMARGVDDSASKGSVSSTILDGLDDSASSTTFDVVNNSPSPGSVASTILDVKKENETKEKC